MDVTFGLINITSKVISNAPQIAADARRSRSDVTKQIKSMIPNSNYFTF
jgi:hypothetical protein